MTAISQHMSLASARQSSVPYPARASPFYSLRSASGVAELKDSTASSPKHSTAATVRRSFDRSQEIRAAPPPSTEAEMIEHLQKVRDKLLANDKKLDDDIAEARKRFAQDKRSNKEAKVYIKQNVDKAKVLDKDLRDELARIHMQQKQLRELRSELKETLMQKPSRLGSCNISAMAATPAHSMSLPVVDTWKTEETSIIPSVLPQMSNDHAIPLDVQPLDLSMTGTSDTAMLATTSLSVESAPTAVPSPSAVPVDATLESLLLEMQAVTKACATTVPESSSQGITSADIESGEDEDEDADIELLRSNGIAVAVLRHPKGAELLVDLRGGLVVRCRFATGRTTCTGSVPALWPDILSTIESSEVRWCLALMDDSNNEPSVTLVCSTADCRLQRKLTLGATWLSEEISIENTSSGELRSALREKTYSDLVKEQPTGELVPSRNSEPGLQLHRFKPGEDGGPVLKSLAVPAAGKWSMEQCWAPSNARSAELPSWARR